MPLLPYRNILPTIGNQVFIAETATVIGDTHIGDESNIWYGVTIRGDVHEIRIGKRTNIQDGSVIHTTRDVSGTYIGDEVTVGHMALLHACTVKDRAFVGMGAIMLDESVLEEEAMLAAGAVLTPKKVVPSGQLWAGNPAKYMRDLKPEEITFFKQSAENYVQLAAEYL